MLAAAAFIIIIQLTPLGSRFVADIIVSVAAIVLIVRSDRAFREVRALGCATCGMLPQQDGQPSRAMRRAMAKSMNLTMRRAEMASLFPDTFARAGRIAERQLHRRFS